ncbi:HET-domain-containing protein, partial [Thozetella sp. PMI_491]
VQIGMPHLPRAGSPAHLEILRQWLHACDDKNGHPRCHTSGSMRDLPTRLLDVGHDGDDFVRLWETGLHDVGEYIALSHPWGRAPHFVTDPDNLEQHKKGIPFRDLPATFRDAITVTRSLGKRYLWIDSICIMQGPRGDFAAQAKKMETVFSSAYCVLAASRSHSHFEGFLQDRRPRDYVTIRGSGNDAVPFYICENIDYFDHHVLEGHLNKRGWVLQEHALARRTIFFTEHQTYWECGDGVRCETLTKMSNNLAAFLGDPNFPQITMSASQGEKIIRFQDLYKVYSRLGFTNPFDRAVAIDGIQSRLLNAFRTRGGFGIFDEDVKSGQRGLLRRSLLWHRAPAATLAKIEFPSSRALSVPSWSWMAYTGEIDYLRPDFGNVDWEFLASPWSGSGKDRLGTTGLTDQLTLNGLARDIFFDAAEDGTMKIFFDIPGGSERSSLKCVVLGVESGNRPLSSRLHYFLLVAPAQLRSRSDLRAFQRIGAGLSLGKYILPSKGEMVEIH